MLSNHRLVQRLNQRRRGPVTGMRSMLIIGGGAMRGAYGAGVMVALHQLGLGQAFDVVIGNSTGAPTGAYFLAGQEQTKVAATVYYQEAARDFIRWSRIRHPVDFQRLMNVFRSGPKALDTQAIMNSSSEFFVLATRRETGQTELIDAKRAQPDLLAAINASIAIPSLTDPVQVNGHEYFDGDIDPLPSPMIIERFKPTDVLIVPNQQERSFRNWLGRLDDFGFSMLTLGHKNRELTQKALTRSQRQMMGIKYFVSAPEVTVGIIWPPHTHRLHTFMTDAERLKTAYQAAARETFRMFGRSELVPDTY